MHVEFEIIHHFLDDIVKQSGKIINLYKTMKENFQKFFIIQKNIN